MRLVSYAAALALLTATAACGDNRDDAGADRGPDSGPLINSPQTYQGRPTTGSHIGRPYDPNVYR
jgi:hypothetical protein